MYGSLTGDGASFGQSSREGTELAVDEINAAGGLLGGRKIKLLVEDDQSKPEEASNAVTKLITQDKVVAVLGEVASRRSLAAAPVCQKYQVPMITPVVDQRARHRGRRLHLPRLLHRSVPGRGARQVRVQRPEGAEGRDPQGHPAGLLGRPHRRRSSKHFTALGGQVLDPVSYSIGRRRLQGDPHAGPQPEAGRDLRHRATTPRRRSSCGRRASSA